ncbi:MAG: hypothetical protein ACK5FV_02625 [Bacteroidota bacterium]
MLFCSFWQQLCLPSLVSIWLTTGLTTLPGSRCTDFPEAAPNPSAGAISVYLESERSLETRLYITDMTGRPVFHAPVCVSAGENIIPVSPGNIPAGIYQIRIPGIGVTKMVRSE